MIDARGNWQRVIGTSGMDSAILDEVYAVLPKGVLIAGDEEREPLERSIHAEIRNLDFAARTGGRFIAMGATNKMCDECVDDLDKAGVYVSTRVKNPIRPRPFSRDVGPPGAGQRSPTPASKPPTTMQKPGRGRKHGPG
jgi:hypothetical protein